MPTTPSPEALNVSPPSAVRSSASRFALRPDLGDQQPQIRRQTSGRPLRVVFFLALLAFLLITRDSPEGLISRFGFDLGSWPLLREHALALILGGLMLVVAASGYRPLGGLLGFGALPLPAITLALGSPTAAALCFLGLLSSTLILRRWSRRAPLAPRERRSAGRALLDACHAGIATLIAATLWVLLAEGTPAIATAVSTVIWMFVAHGLDQLHHRSQASGSVRLLPRRSNLLWDGFGWCLACSLALVAVQTGLSSTLPVVIGYAMLCTLGTSRELDRNLHLRRIRNLQHVGSMTQRLTPNDQASELAAQCLIEVRRAVEFSHFELDFETHGRTEHFHAVANSPLLSGKAEVPAHPAPAPGFHARRDWLLIERELRSRTADAGASGAELGDRLGTLRVWIDPRHSDDHDHSIIDDLVAQVAALVDRSRLDREARLDPLTGLTRRHVFERELERRLHLAQDEGHSVALLLFDLDHFKQINDQYGHDAGDRVLEAVASVLLRASEPGGLACRWGGEELALLQWSGGRNALVFADELRSFVASLRVATESGALSVSTSVGVAAFPDLLIRSPEELVKLADEALYAAKARGRNKALLACGRGRFRTPSGHTVGETGALDQSRIPQL